MNILSGKGPVSHICLDRPALLCTSVRTENRRSLTCHSNTLIHRSLRHLPDGNQGYPEYVVNILSRKGLLCHVCLDPYPLYILRGESSIINVYLELTDSQESARFA